MGGRMHPARAAGLVVLLAVAGAGLTGTALADEPEPIVLFEDQRTSGSIVLVDLVQLPDSGFLVLHEGTGGPELGPVRGASTLLGAGLHESVPVLLYENMTASTSLVAAVYEDSNANRVLDLGDGHSHHGHEHQGEDEVYTAEGRPIGDEARVEPYEDGQQADDEGVNPLLVGALTALASLVLWAVRYR